MSLSGRLLEELANTSELAVEETPDRTGNSGMSGLKVVFFFPLLPEEAIIKVVEDFFLFKRGCEAGKKGFQAMRKKLGEKIGVVFSFAVVVMYTELFSFLIILSPTTHYPCCLTYISNTNPYLKASFQPDICSDEDIQDIKISTPNLELIQLFNIINERRRYDHSLPYTIERTVKKVSLPPTTILACWNICPEPSPRDQNS